MGVSPFFEFLTKQRKEKKGLEESREKEKVEKGLLYATNLPCGEEKYDNNVHLLERTVKNIKYIQLLQKK